ncbi:MAG: putative enzyme related to lactoylglutathione lyase [Pirellulaceae bacterium]|jgi:predicted enzyme related to lactoylglutathione lyase
MAVDRSILLQSWRVWYLSFTRRGAITDEVRLGFQVNSMEDSLQQLKALNAEVVAEPKEIDGGVHAVVSDPDGHRVVLTERQ